MKTLEVTKKEELDFLYNESAVTIIGLDENTIGDWVNWLKENDYAENTETLTVYVIKGLMMNYHYSLTGKNRYQDDLTIISIPLSELKNVNKLAINPMRWHVGYRWFDDIVDNNSYRERNK